MSYIESTAPQGSALWLADRAGKFTGSEIHKLMGAKGLGKTGETYILEKAAECLTKTPKEPVYSKNFEHGHQMEPIIKEKYEQITFQKVEEIGFCIPDWCADCGASPDGKISTNAGIEIKAPATQVEHLRNLLIKSAADLKAEKPEYYWQVQMELAVTGWEYIDYVSCHLFFPDDLYFHRVLIAPHIADIELMKERIFEAVKIRNEFIRRVKGI